MFWYEVGILHIVPLLFTRQSRWEFHLSSSLQNIIDCESDEAGQSMVCRLQLNKLQDSKNRRLGLISDYTPEFLEWWLNQPSPNSNNGDPIIENAIAGMIMHQLKHSLRESTTAEQNVTRCLRLAGIGVNFALARAELTIGTLNGSTPAKIIFLGQSSFQFGVQ